MPPAKPQLSFEDFLNDTAGSANDTVEPHTASIWDSGVEGIEKACAERPEIFANRCSMQAAKLTAMYGYEPATAEHPAIAAIPLPGELALRLHQAHTLPAHELKRLRRDLALWHHPDRHSPELHEVTEGVMKVVNAIIDEALRKRPKS